MSAVPICQSVLVIKLSLGRSPEKMKSNKNRGENL